MQTSSGCSRKLDFFLEILKTANLVQCPQVEEQRVCETCGRANIIFDGSSLLISLPTHLVPSTRMCVIDTEREGEKRESRSRRRDAVHESIDLAILERLQPYTSLGYPSIPFSFSSNNSGAFSLKKFMYLWQRVSYCFFLGDVICSDQPENYKLPLLPPPPSSPFNQPITQICQITLPDNLSQSTWLCLHLNILAQTTILSLELAATSLLALFFHSVLI